MIRFEGRPVLLTLAVALCAACGGTDRAAPTAATAEDIVPTGPAASPPGSSTTSLAPTTAPPTTAPPTTAPPTTTPPSSSAPSTQPPTAPPTAAEIIDAITLPDEVAGWPTGPTAIDPTTDGAAAFREALRVDARCEELAGDAPAAFRGYPNPLNPAVDGGGISLYASGDTSFDESSVDSIDEVQRVADCTEVGFASIGLTVEATAESVAPIEAGSLRGTRYAFILDAPAFGIVAALDSTIALAADGVLIVVDLPQLNAAVPTWSEDDIAALVTDLAARFDAGRSLAGQ